MSTLSAELRAWLVLVYDFWVPVAMTVAFLYIPVLVHRLKHSEVPWRRDFTGIMCLAIVLIALGTAGGRAYFLVTMHHVNMANFTRVNWWIDHFGWLAVVAQTLPVLGFLLLMHLYYAVPEVSRGGWRSLWHIALGWTLLAVIAAGELMGVWW